MGGHLLGGLGSDLLCKAMDDGALPSIEQLDLSVNSIGELAVRPFGLVSCSRLTCPVLYHTVCRRLSQALNLAQWLAKGTRPSLQRLLLGDNKISGLLFLEAGIPEEVRVHCSRPYAGRRHNGGHMLFVALCDLTFYACLA